MNPVEGRIDIDLHPAPGEATRVDVESSRPLQACRVMIGKAPDEVLSLLPLMFNVCGVAQARATLAAIQRELGVTVRQGDEAARDLLVAVETAREHLLRIFLDWPRLFELDFDNRVLPRISHLNSDFAACLFRGGNGFALHSTSEPDQAGLAQQCDRLEAILQESVFGVPCDEWLALRGITELESWLDHDHSVAARATAQIHRRGWSELAQTSCADLPELSAQDLLARFSDESVDRFVALPQWDGQCYETTPLSRQRCHPLVLSLGDDLGSGLLVRWVARLVELATIPGRIANLGQALVEDDQVDVEMPVDTVGIAQVEAARGRLVHRVSIDDGVVADYRILAPTEWNFHPDGIIGEGLAQLTERKSIDVCARTVINAIDPCVGYHLRVH
ncbi:MAG: nickel-dependent hydrogenase large subunit [Gammaproteobacteria bacterium]|nr:nickel-dependent hydrogenase large subunit [Gammaproteobacteria bacterium]